MMRRDDVSGRTEIRRAVLALVHDRPATLATVVSRLEGLVMGELNGSPRCISRFLHEMQRDGEIVLATDEYRWWVRLGPKGHGASAAN